MNFNRIFFSFIQYVVMPTRRSTAEAFQILISHAFGDAGSPYMIGLISEALKAAMHNNSVGNNSFELHSLARRHTNITSSRVSKKKTHLITKQQPIFIHCFFFFSHNLHNFRRPTKRNSRHCSMHYFRQVSLKYWVVYSFC